MKKINELFGRLKEEPSKIFRVLSVSNEGDFVDAVCSNGHREAIETFKIEPATQEDIDNYKIEEDNSPIFLNL